MFRFNYNAKLARSAKLCMRTFTEKFVGISTRWLFLLLKNIY